ncbi:interleukin-20 receptor subunit alpha isoform X2 [Colossoma macropomum]|uniref:interleukin-20 receptor subunit alpha isoform X2 n=1 Tax=Colossoma macropomum TaxID=42526 RepID=UPI0018647C80|nr:interleukin-20 receptor subunit alpha isoform X2 [Colossoma macropomum]
MMRTIMVMKMASDVLVAALPLCLLLHAASAEGSAVAAPQNVHFHSMNLRNMLRWGPGGGTVHGTTYTVEYAIYGDVEGDGEQVVWSPAEQCRNITDTECDLTEQTYDINEDYYARVRANRPHAHSHWVETESRFRPLSDTIFGPPNVKVTLVDNYMHVKLKGPFRWKSSRMKRGYSVWKIFPHMVYNISVYNNRSKHMHHFLLQNDSLRLGPLEYESVQCVKAESLSLSLPLTSIPSDWSCIMLPPDPFTAQMLVLILGGVVPSAICLFVLAAVGGFAYYYICGHKQRLPMSTDLVHVDEKQKLFQPDKPVTIINLNLISTNLSTQESKLRPWGPRHHFVSGNEHLQPVQALPARREGEPEDPPPGGEIVQSYAAQDVQHQAEFNSASDVASDLGSSNEFLSDDYGLVLREQDPQLDMSGLAVPDMLNPKVEEPPECKVDLYMAQSRERDSGEKSYEEEAEQEEKEEGTFLDWDPRTGVLKIPLLCQLGSEVPTATEKETEPKTRVDIELLQRRPILTSVVVRQCSEESGEEDDFSKMEKHWGLQIQSSPE